MGGPAWGDTGVSQIARAVGAGGESVRSLDEQERKAQESEAKINLSEARADAAAARAGQAGSNLDVARQRLAIQEMEGERKRQSSRFQGKIRLSAMYQNYLRDIAKQNADVMRKGPPIQPLGIKDWVKQNPMLKEMGLIDEDTDVSDEDTAPSMTGPRTQTQTPGPVTLDNVQPGQVYNGHRYKGGDKKLQSSWEKI